MESDFKIKAKYFNYFFGSECTLLVVNSKLPDKTTFNSTATHSINFDNSNILKIIRSLNVNKAHGHNDITVRMKKKMISKL